MIKLPDILKIVPAHSRIGIVERLPNKTMSLIYSGTRIEFDKYCKYKCIYSSEYIVTSIHESSWDLKKGIAITIEKQRENYEKS